MDIEGCRIPARELLHGARSFRRPSSTAAAPRAGARMCRFASCTGTAAGKRSSQFVAASSDASANGKATAAVVTGTASDRSDRSQDARRLICWTMAFGDDALTMALMICAHPNPPQKAMVDSPIQTSFNVPARLQDLCKLQSNDRIGRRQNHFYHRRCPHGLKN